MTCPTPRPLSEAEQKASNGTITIPPPTPKARRRTLRRGRCRSACAGHRLYSTSVDPLASIVRTRSRAALFLDVDGVLAPIVERPEDARVPDETRRGARSASPAATALVACVTGRAERASRARSSASPELTLRRRARPRARPDAQPRGPTRIHAFARERGLARPEREAADGGIPLPPAADRTRARAQLEPIAAAALAAGASGRAGGGWCSRCCRRSTRRRAPRCARCSRETGLRRALYAGDDTTDLDGFAALDGLDAAVRVAVASTEGRRSSAGGPTCVVGSTRGVPRAAAAALELSEAEALAQLARLAPRDVELGLALRLRAASRNRSGAARRTPATLPRLTRYERWMRAKRRGRAAPRARRATPCRGTSGRRCARGCSRRRPARSAPGRGRAARCRRPATTGIFSTGTAFSCERSRSRSTTRASRSGSTGFSR